MSVRWPLARRQWQGARPYQEDAYGTREIDIAGSGEAPALLLVLADGMGGAAGGAVASRIATDAFIGEFAGLAGTVSDRLRACLDTATARLRQRETEDTRLLGMGTTLVAALHDGRGVDWLSVGDSPMWLFADGGLERLNADHSMAPMLEELVRRGEMTPDQARHDGRRHMLRSAVTGRPAGPVDRGYRACRLLPGEFLLIASDGIETLPVERIARELREARGDAEAAADALDSALRAAAGPYQDNATFLLLSAGP